MKLTTTILSRRRLAAIILTDISRFGALNRYADRLGMDSSNMRRAVVSQVGWDDTFERAAAGWGGEWDRAVASAGVNDPPGRCVAQVRARLHARHVVWLIGRSPCHREASTVPAIALDYGDAVVWFTPGRDGVHPRSYVGVAAQVRREW